MDKALYIAMTGARATLQAQGTVSHNLANADTAGFKAALANTEAFPVRGSGHASRIAALHVDQGFDARAGALQVTGNALDVSLQADRWLAVQAPDGGEAYTRAGNLSTDDQGRLVTDDGYTIEPAITIPQDATDIIISATGQVQVTQPGNATPTGSFTIDRVIWNPGWVPPDAKWARGKRARWNGAG